MNTREGSRFWNKICSEIFNRVYINHLFLDSFGAGTIGQCVFLVTNGGLSPGQRSM